MDRYDAVGLIGLTIAAIGCGLIYAPLGLIVLGSGLMAGAVIGARGVTLTPPLSLKGRGHEEPKQ